MRQPNAKLDAGALAGGEDRLLAVAERLDAALCERDRAAAAALAVADARVWLEVLHVQARAIAVALEALADRLEQPGGATEERLALAPVGAELVEVRSGHAPLLAGALLVQPIARVARVEQAQLLAEDHTHRRCARCARARRRAGDPRRRASAACS